MVDDFSESPNTPSERSPEYFMLYKYDSIQGAFIFIDSARWDTATPKIYKLRRGCNDTMGYLYGRIYEARFKSPIWVDSAFYVGGTYKSNYPGNPFNPYYTWYHSVVQRRGVHINDSTTMMCTNAHRKFYRFPNGWTDHFHAPSEYTVFFPMVENGIMIPDTVTVHSVDSTMGSVSGSGVYRCGSFVTITAIPAEGYLFQRWNDGRRENPRRVYVTKDTSFTAYFRTEEHYTVTTNVNDTLLGHVIGGGTYAEQTRVTLTAVPSEDAIFLSWTDGVADNPREITVTQDTAFTALLQGTAGISRADQRCNITLKPNPTEGKVTLTSSHQILSVDVNSVTGQLLQRIQASGDNVAGNGSALPGQPSSESIYSVTLDLSACTSGTYLLCIHTVRGTATRKVVVK